ncbi:uncharacterized protein LOC134771091 isoform X1 [Penaeus indicus]|uniref:uncharacterized protein LOC134771091 isoform X1 n=1 Tax=Penaeus indicus TaxID=29960 RepID=UPI00300C34FB
MCCFPCCCCKCCCDPHKLTYISAIITGVEAGVFAILNIVLLSMHSCTLEPPEKLGGGLDKFWDWYFYDEQECQLHHDNYTAPSWINATQYPLDSRPRTTVEENVKYQITYLILHSSWLLSCLLLIYGNARKLWGYYLPWVLITLTLLIMDVVVASFFMHDLSQIPFGFKSSSAMIWAFSMYLRGYVIWLINLVEFGTGLNAFSKTYHKRTKEARKMKKVRSDMVIIINRN